MKTYKYVASDKYGTKFKSIIHAENIADVINRLKRKKKACKILGLKI